MPELTCGAAPAVVETAKISASAVPARMLIRALCIDAYSTAKLARVIERAPRTAPRRDAKRDTHSKPALRLRNGESRVNAATRKGSPWFMASLTASGCVGLSRLFRLLVEAEMLELAIERRAADPQAPRHLGHLSAVMRDGKTDRFELELFERAHVAVRVEQPQRAGRRWCAWSDTAIVVVLH